MVLALAVAAQAVAAAPLDLDARRVALNPDEPTQTTVGALEFVGGLELWSDEADFGGLSGLEIGADGARMLAVGDHGHWVAARLIDAADGALVGVADATIHPILDDTGRPVADAWRDAEEVARLADGRLAVSFERRHRIWLYPAGNPAHGRGRALGVASVLAQAPYNGGVEALTALADGRLLAVTEKASAGDGRVQAWLIAPDGGRAEALAYAVSDGFAPTALARLADGDVLALERRYSKATGAAARLMRIDAASIVPGAVLEGRELARIEAPLNVDNFEGLAVRRGAGGETFVYLLSDDNFNSSQRTLLMQFRLSE